MYYNFSNALKRNNVHKVFWLEHSKEKNDTEDMAVDLETIKGLGCEDLK
jgi:Uri superfamily endonuclease